MHPFLTLCLSLLLLPPVEERVVFLVDPYMDESGFYCEPIAYILPGGKFAGVVDPMDTSFAPYRKFSAIYFRTGRTYSLFHHDKRLGELTVVAADSEFACMQLTAQVTVHYAGNGKLGEPGLAFSGEHAEKPLLSEAGSSRDSALAMKLATKEFAKQKLSKETLSKIQLNRLRTIDVDGDGDMEAIATFETMSVRYSKKLKYDMTMIYFLTLVIDNGAVAYSHYVSGAEEGDEDGNFASRKDIAGVSDLNGDGVAEIVFRNFYYEAWDYAIVRKQGGRWQQVWQGGGGGC